MQAGWPANAGDDIRSYHMLHGPWTYPGSSVATRTPVSQAS